ncbi:alanine racemase [Candidatus Nomurabacteria bacterium]|nr:alanine racemase [Candidatus Nomurabacteria bacterium]
MDTFPLSYIEISAKNLIQNIKSFKNFLKKETQISVVVKSNAYGHGLSQIVAILDNYVDCFQVDSIEELQILRKISKRKTFVFGYVQESDLSKAIKLNCTLSVFSQDYLYKIEKISNNLKRIQEVHLVVDAFLGREGVLLQELPKLFEEIKKCKYIKLTGIYSHFANIEDSKDLSHAKKQISIFNISVNLAKEYGFNNLQNHISATSGILVHEMKVNNPLVRIGIGAYGLWPAEHLKEYSKINLKPILTWKTKVAQIKILPKGYTIGYGLTYKTKKETKVAIIPQGYGDGLDRRLSNKGEFLINDKRCKILGRVMMNMCVVDISHLPKIKVEDEVVILGRQGKEYITAEEIANKMGTINYEITTHISALLPRVSI